jgi:hypothetical protein
MREKMGWERKWERKDAKSERRLPFLEYKLVGEIHRGTKTTP